MKNAGLFFVFALIAVAGILFLFSRAPVQEPAQPNVTVNVSDATGLQKGDLVTLNYVLLFENGTVADTNNATLAQEHNVRNYVKGPYQFILGQSGKVVGFDDALVGLQVGDEAELIIEPSEEEVILTIKNERSMDRFVTMAKNQRIKIPAFEAAYGSAPEIGRTYRADGEFPVRVVNMTERTVLAELLVRKDDTYVLQNTEWPSKVASVQENDVLFYQQPEENQSLDTPFGPATIELTKSTYTLNYNPELGRIVNHSVNTGQGFSIPQQFRITNVTPSTFTIKRWGLLTDKRLTLRVEIVDNTPGVKKVREGNKIVETVTA